MDSPFSLSGKNIVITGASSGIGRQCAILCSYLGAKLTLIGRNTDRLKDTLILLHGKDHLICPYDITEKQIKNDLKNHLSEYKIPRIINFVNEIELTNTGKVKKVN